MNIIWIYIAGWIGLLALAILNGTLREKTYGKFMGELTAHQLSTLTGIVLFGIYIWIFTMIFTIETSGQALVIGGMWLVMTVAFEFAFGHFVMGHPWKRLLSDYNIFKGRVWILLLLWIALAPYLFFQFG